MAAVLVLSMAAPGLLMQRMHAEHLLLWLSKGTVCVSSLSIPVLDTTALTVTQALKVPDTQTAVTGLLRQRVSDKLARQAASLGRLILTGHHGIMRHVVPGTLP